MKITEPNIFQNKWAHNTRKESKYILAHQTRAKGEINTYLSVKLQIFSYPSILTCVLGAQKNCLIETVLLSTHNICFG